MSWKTISVLFLFTVAFLNGLIFQGWSKKNYLVWIVWIVCSILIVAILGISKIRKSIKENAGAEKMIAIILIILVLIPLVFLGTCLLAVSGDFVRSLFFK